MSRALHRPVNRIRLIGLALAVVSGQVGGVQAAVQHRQALTLGVRCPSGLRSSSVAAVPVSNLGLIELEAGMHYFDVPPVQTSPGPLDLILTRDEGRPSTEQPNLEIEVVTLGPAGRVPVAARFHSTGVSGGTEYHDKLPSARFVHAISVSFSVPLEETSQRASFAQFLDELRRAGKSDEARRLEPFQTNRAMLEQLVREHQPGQYELTARYRPRPADYSQAEFKSAPLRLDILAKGRWFDALLAGRSPPAGGCE